MLIDTSSKIYDGIYDPPNENIILAKIIFLDIDGVLTNSSIWKLKESSHLDDNFDNFDIKCVRRLEKIIQATDAHIVVTSSWRNYDVPAMREIFKKRKFKYFNRIIGETMRGYHFVQKGIHLPIVRGIEIKAWIDKFIRKTGEGFTNNEFSYVIIDDDTDMLYQQRNNFIHTSTELGLQDKDIEKAIYILNQSIIPLKLDK